MRAVLLALALVVPATARANECKVIELDFTPAEIAIAAAMRANSQIVAWIEDPAGNYVETVFITQQTGTFGLGNRPGRFDFNSGPKWPYGRRMVFPIWAQRHGITFEEVEFQNQDESNLSHPFNESSRENRFCRPLMPTEGLWDTGTCASAVFTDKGELMPGKASKYPPRNDVVRATPDHPSVEMFSPNGAVVESSRSGWSRSTGRRRPATCWTGGSAGARQVPGRTCSCSTASTRSLRAAAPVLGDGRWRRPPVRSRPGTPTCTSCSPAGPRPSPT